MLYILIFFDETDLILKIIIFVFKVYQICHSSNPSIDGYFFPLFRRFCAQFNVMFGSKVKVCGRETQILSPTWAHINFLQIRFTVVVGWVWLKLLKKVSVPWISSSNLDIFIGSHWITTILIIYMKHSKFGNKKQFYFIIIVGYF